MGCGWYVGRGVWWGGVGFGSTEAGMTMMMNVEERIRFLLRTAIRAEGEGDQRIANLFRRMAEDLRTGESALVPTAQSWGS